MRNIANEYGKAPLERYSDDWQKLRDYPHAKEALHQAPNGVVFHTVTERVCETKEVITKGFVEGNTVSEYCRTNSDDSYTHTIDLDALESMRLVFTLPNDTTGDTWKAIQPKTELVKTWRLEKHDMCWDRLLGVYRRVADMKWVRFYDVQVFSAIKRGSQASLVWLSDLDQYVLEDDWENERSNSDAIVVDGTYYWDVNNADNVRFCEYTDEWCNRDDMVYLYDEDDYCSREYADNNCFYCESDDNWYRNESNAPSNRALYDYGECAKQLLGWGDKESTLKFSVMTRDKKWEEKSVWLGVELELDNDDRNDFAETVHSRHNWLIVKEDGSLDDDNGLELVTKPMSLIEHQTKWEEFFNKYMTRCDAPQGDYGLHVHISKNCLTKVEQARISKFVCDKGNRDFMMQLSRRYSSTECDRWASFDRHNLNTNYFFSYEAKGKHLDDPERYSAVNLTKDATIEFRFFATTDDYQEFMQSVEFCQAIAHYVHDTRNQSAATIVQMHNFYVFICMKAETYPALHKYMQDVFKVTATVTTIAA